MCGTPDYIAPEIFKGDIQTTQVDVFSLGVVFYQILFKNVPFPGLYYKLYEKDFEYSDIQKTMKINYYNSEISQNCKDLINSMLKFDPNDRITLEQIFNHELFSNFSQLAEV